MGVWRVHWNEQVVTSQTLSSLVLNENRASIGTKHTTYIQIWKQERVPNNMIPNKKILI